MVFVVSGGDVVAVVSRGNVVAVVVSSGNVVSIEAIVRFTVVNHFTFFCTLTN